MVDVCILFQYGKDHKLIQKLSHDSNISQPTVFAELYPDTEHDTRLHT